MEHSNIHSVKAMFNLNCLFKNINWFIIPRYILFEQIKYVFKSGYKLFSGGRSNKLREHLYEGSQYYLISEKGWNHLHESYGLKDGQEPIERCVVEFGLHPNLKVEVYLIELKLFTFKTMDHGYTKTYSRVTILGKN